jgi:hypothetical protein
MKKSFFLTPPPKELDQQILSFAANYLKSNRRKRIVRNLMAVAATIAIAIGVVFVSLTTVEKNNQQLLLKEQQLLAMADWSLLEQESYNLSTEVNLQPNSLTSLASMVTLR